MHANSASYLGLRCLPLNCTWKLQHLSYAPAGTHRWNNVDSTLIQRLKCWCWINVKSTLLCACCGYYCACDIPRKDVYCLALYSKLKHWFWLTISDKNHLSFWTCACFQIFTAKLFMIKNKSDLCNFYSKLDFCKTLLKNIFFLFLTDFILSMVHNNIVKISETLNKCNLLKTASKLTTLSTILQPCLLWGKWKYSIFLNQWLG